MVIKYLNLARYSNKQVDVSVLWYHLPHWTITCRLNSISSLFMNYFVAALYSYYVCYEDSLFTLKF